MANPFSKGWKYLMSSLDHKIDENADPKVQIQQAAEEARRQHREISAQAANVLGNQRQLELKLNRLQEDQQSLQDKARQAVRMSDEAAAQGDQAKAQEFGQTAEVFATQLVAVEQQLEDAKKSHAQAAAAAEQARRQQAESEARLKEQLSQIDQLRAQVDQTRMQEASTEALGGMDAVRADDSVPTLDGVRDKIERRYADALGAQELTRNSVTDRMAEISQAGTDMRAAARLDEIRAQMDSEGSAQLDGGQRPALSDAASPAAEADQADQAGQSGSAAGQGPRPDADAPGASDGPGASDDPADTAGPGSSRVDR